MSPPRPFPGLTGPGRAARWRRSVLRRLLSAVCAAGAVAGVVHAVRPPPPPLSPVLVAARDVPAGSVLDAGHLTVVDVPDPARQPGALSVLADAVGRRVGSALASGEALTSTRLVPRTASDGLASGHVAVHVHLVDPGSVDLLTSGARVLVYPAEGGEPLADDATVLAVDPPVPVGPLGGEQRARGVVLEVADASARAVLAGHGSLSGGPVVAVVVTAT
ncbi:hypothetical protein KC207_16200 [Phycicoccus sp. BSK3Z-2]|uniref:SAF domain-containing protein n=1 Tax=Phycicoccus avicenniae TaxID=2828860 RepID=A0A941DA70_9MICO|nr:SAF domain-containing protein [Phycicoccus avicenniae]MBR7744838.1 hypothetical protein [Phycicoccus avicenniae]